MRRVLCFGIVILMILCSLPLNIFAVGDPGQDLSAQQNPERLPLSDLKQQTEGESQNENGNVNPENKPSGGGDKNDMAAPPAGITYSPVGEKPASCTEAGMKAHYVGSDGKLYVDDGTAMTPVSQESLVLPALGHQWGPASRQWSGISCIASRSCLREGCGQEQLDIATIKPGKSILEPEYTVYYAIFHEPWAKKFDLSYIKVKNEDSKDPTDPVNPGDPTDPENNTDPTDPENNTDPTDPENNTDPTDPENNTDPTDPENSTDPTQPKDPPKPVKPVAPNKKPPVKPEGSQNTEAAEETTEATIPVQTETEGTVPPETHHTEDKNLSLLGTIRGATVHQAENGVVLVLKPGKQKEAMQAELSMKDLKQICSSLEEGERLTLTNGRLGLSYDRMAMEQVVKQAVLADTVCFSMEKQRSEDKTLNKAQRTAVHQEMNAQLYSIQLELQTGSATREVHDFGGGSSQITVPCNPKSYLVETVYRVEEDGSLTELPCRRNAENGTISFETPSHSHYMVVRRLNVVILPWILSSCLLLALFTVMYKNRRGYLINLF